MKDDERGQKETNEDNADTPDVTDGPVAFHFNAASGRFWAAAAMATKEDKRRRERHTTSSTRTN